MAPYGPGTYFIKRNAAGTPSLYTQDGSPIDDPRFESAGNSSFFFSIDRDESIAFDRRPIAWRDFAANAIPEPYGNSHSVVDRKVLVLNVIPPVLLPVPQITYFFTLRLNVGDSPSVLWASDGSRVVDPTIVENPPNNG